MILFLSCSGLLFAGQADSTIKTQDKGNSNGIITSNWGDYFNITRLQERTSTEGRTSLMQSTFVRFPSKLFLLESYEHTFRYKKDPNISFLEIFFGGTIEFYKMNPKLFGWVSRLQSGTQMVPQYSIGVQYNLSDHLFLTDIRKKFPFTMFIQYFPLKNDDKLGRYDIVHYYSFPVYKKFYLRGNTRFLYYKSKKNYYQAFQDLILPVNSHFDIYARHSYQNMRDVQFGEEGSEWAAGVRLNFSL